MAFLASTQIPADAYAEAKRIANTLDAKCEEWIGFLASDVDADQVWSLYRELKHTLDRLNAIAAVTGIKEYAQAQEELPDYEVVVEFGVMTTAITNAGTWVYNAIPRDGSGYTLTHTTTTLGERIPRIFTPTQTAPLVPLLQAIVDAIA